MFFLGASFKEKKYPQKKFLILVFVKTFVGNCNFFPFSTQSTSILKVAESSGLSNQSDDENEESDYEKLDNAIKVVYQNLKCVLYRRYGRNLIFLDATYKTTKYVLPLYFIVIQTNVNHQVIMHFIFVI